MRGARGYTAVVQVKTTTAAGKPILVESGQCIGSQSETKTVT